MRTWAGTAAAYGRSFATLCAGTIPTLLEATSTPAPHAIELLDVGCGAGDLAHAAAAEGRQVLAVDPDPGMVALSREASTAGPGTVTVLEAGAPRLPVADGAAGAVTANFVVNHVPDPRASLRDIARVAAPGAPVALTIWPAGAGPHLTAYAKAAQAAGARPVPAERLAPELDFPRTQEGLAGLARAAGLQVERAEEVRWIWQVSPDDLMAGIDGGVAGPGRLHRAQSPEVREEIEARARALWEAHRDGDLLAFPVRAALVVARR
ncbi:class I SAM-dependent methyltransferase [Brachybacterium sp. NBEC-018]|uniref:class I SAM-dependent methyltransferase n=1 Tax=Brachybacterium sp. NBEC-018 TaxID=2996004 RepID=UPI002174DD17|nr:class I SAM-dependent methyltransferase [Brachybacterium sp. NBEC-018]UVY83943.1 class I SAM-dependent methyltransferase [Brachybacterium sp. NBEC-018]